MSPISDEVFQELIDQAYDRLPERHRQAIKNVAIVTADEPSPEQRTELQLHCNQTLLGLYQGVPLTQRQGKTNLYAPDIITLFKNPLLAHSHSEAELAEHIYHTLWHEVAHYFGLSHDDIHAREKA
ncbi:metallopeptidase family protein [Candidatus Saccharibacteria bacterium]|nr:metallopeptidase family protein [Candidatus Saccharibacteria bacterium]